MEHMSLAIAEEDVKRSPPEKPLSRARAVSSATAELGITLPSTLQAEESRFSWCRVMPVLW